MSSTHKSSSKCKDSDIASVRAYAKRSRETEVVEKKGGCDGIAAKFATTNGVPQTWKWIENVGTCPVTFACLDSNGNVIKSTIDEIPPGDSLVSYSAPSSAHTVTLNCPENDATNSTCKIEIDA